MAKKATPVSVNITGSTQAETITSVFDAKTAADAAKAKYDAARKGSMSLILGKIFKHWTKSGKKNVGAYEFALPDGTTRTVNVQNRQSTKTCDPSDAKEIMARLNLDCEPKAQLKPADVYNVVTDHGLHPEAMAIPRVRAKILETRVSLEAEMKENRDLPPEVSLVQEDKKLVLADHALDRILALSNDFEAAMETVGNPVTANLVTKKTTK
jgi:hypothetical protein